LVILGTPHFFVLTDYANSTNYADRCKMSGRREIHTRHRQRQMSSPQTRRRREGEVSTQRDRREANLPQATIRASAPCHKRNQQTKERRSLARDTRNEWNQTNKQKQSANAYIMSHPRLNCPETNQAQVLGKILTPNDANGGPERASTGPRSKNRVSQNNTATPSTLSRKGEDRNLPRE